MAVTVLSMPALLGFKSKVFDLMHKQQVTPIGSGGFIQTIERTTPFWSAKYTTPPLRDTRYDETIAFLDSLEGAVNPFYAFDPRRVMPRAYASSPIASDPWTQTGQTAPRVTAFSFNLATITLDRLQNGAIITKGDYISFKVGNIWYLFRSMDTFTVVANVATLHVQPRPNLVGTLPVAIVYRQAGISMKMVGGYQEDDSVDTFPAFTFAAVQFSDRT